MSGRRGTRADPAKTGPAKSDPVQSDPVQTDAASAERTDVRDPAGKALAAWFAARGWTPARFQREVWRRYARGESGLVHTPTGSGKTLAAIGGPLIEALRRQRAVRGVATKKTRRAAAPPRRLTVLWITPLRALAMDTLRALRTPIDDLGLDWQVALRTGDAGARDKRLARSGRVDVLVTTPESLALLLSYPDAAQNFAHLRMIIVDEWHELVGNKRGVLLQLGLARLRALSPSLRLWGLSATLGNLEEARDVLLPHAPRSAIVSSPLPRAVAVDTLLPDAGERFVWAGHLGLGQLPRVVERIFGARSSLLFTNTRAQAELWHQALAAVWPEDPSTLALHHGSLDASLRADAEQGLRDGRIRCVVATSSLDLGVDYPTVDQVFQIGSPKGVARLQQRAGRARHRPGESGHVICVPTHALELVEYAAARIALARGGIEPRPPPTLCEDVLAQHCVTLALGGGFDADALLAEVRGTHAYAALDAERWQAVLDFIVRGGRALDAYPDHRRVTRDDDGAYRVHERRVALRHRLSIGTIASDGSVSVKLLRGARLGSIEESFVGRLRPGDRFQFAGRMLELFRLEDMTAFVKIAKGAGGDVPQWQGGRMPLSNRLADEAERLFGLVRDGAPRIPELSAISRLLALQRRLSDLPAPGRLLVECIRARDGEHVFVYPFAGRLVHEGLAALCALRLGRARKNSFRYAANDYGFMLSPADPVALDAEAVRAMLAPAHLLDDLREGMNLGELSRRQFREIARIAGLLVPALPGGAPKSMRAVQASSGLIFDVLRRFDPDHILLAQAEREVLQAQLDLPRIEATLIDCAQRSIALHAPSGFTPLSFPLWTDGFRGRLSTEDWQARVRRVAAQLEKRHAR